MQKGDGLLGASELNYERWQEMLRELCGRHHADLCSTGTLMDVLRRTRAISVASVGMGQPVRRVQVVFG
jgi:hypothetical protein